MARANVVRGRGTTRQSIVAAATKRFAAASYDEVSLRDLAADVGVDVAYVHRSFGSKERLFREVLDAQTVDIDLAAVGRDDLAATLARLLRVRAESPGGSDALMILAHSLASPVAGRIVGERLLGEIIEPVRHGIGDPTPFRASLVTSLLIGYGIVRNLLPEAAGPAPAQAETLIANAIDGIVNIRTAEPGRTDR